MTPEKFTSYKLHIPLVDDQHWRMFVMMQDAMSQVRDKKFTDVAETLDALMVDLVHHASDEIRLMKDMGYPFIETHITEHGLLISGMNQVIKNASEGKYENLTTDLEKIVIDHIVQYDALYAMYAKHMTSNLS